MIPRWTIDLIMLRSHVRLYQRISVPKSHGNTSEFEDTVTIFENFNQNTTYFGQTTYRMSDHNLFSEQSSDEIKQEKALRLSKQGLQ